ncbi:MAG: hypothetical protein AAGI53_13575 [Planctomycetota bacterium]
MIPQRVRDRSITPLSIDERDEIATAATAAERSNRPASLVVLAGLVFVIACAIVVVLATRQASARSEVDRLTGEIEQLRELVIELEVAKSDQPTLPESEPILARIETIATEVGIEEQLSLNNTGKTDIAPGIVVARGSYNLNHDDLGEVMEWLRRVTTEIEGVEATRTSFTPRRNDWKIEVTFERYEQAN